MVELLNQSAVMKIDLYTKVVLTVIAGSLICLLFRDVEIVSSAHAEENAKIQSVNIAQISGRTFNTAALPVLVY